MSAVEREKSMKATKICSIILIGFLVALAVGPADAQMNCSRKVVTAIMQEELGKDRTPLSRDVSKEVERCKVMERASAADDRCSAVVARASLINEGIDNPLQRLITQRIDECKGARDSRKAAAANNRCSAEVVRATLVGEGVDNPTQQEVTDRMRSCKADEYYREKIREATSNLDKPNAEKSRQARMTALVNTIDSLRKLRQAWLKPENKDWETEPLVPRGN